VATAFYGIVATLQAGAWLLMWAALRHRPAMFEAGYDASFARVESRLGWIGVAAFAACAAIGLVAPWVSLGLYVIVVIGFGVTVNGWHATARRVTSS
jgi:hypothetical protein